MPKQWSSELAVIRLNTKAVDLYPSNPQGCQNCGGVEIMMVFVIESGPYLIPKGGKVKWLDFPEGDGRKSGWYTGELKIDWCPACHKIFHFS